jgi:hypothetical protein
MKNKFQSAYERLANDQRYISVDFKLKIITWTVAILSGISTAYANGYSHVARLGTEAAIVLGFVTLLIVEGSLYTLEEGLRTTFKGGTQRALATLGKWIIKATMIANAAYLCCVIADLAIPEYLLIWNRWSFAVHFGIGLILIPLIRDADPVVANRMLQLRAETAQEDQIVSRLASALASPFALFGARFRGMWDGLWLGVRLVFNNRGFSAKNYVANLNSLQESQFRYVEGARSVMPVSSPSVTRLSAPIPSAPLIVPVKQNNGQNPKVLAKSRKKGSVGGLSLPDMDFIHFEPNAKGGIEAWFRPSRASTRSERKYLIHFGKKLLAQLESDPNCEAVIRQMVTDAARKKGITI